MSSTQNDKQLASVAFYTLGCRLNQAETATIRRRFEATGYDVVDIAEPADLVVINTCTVTAGGDADTRRAVKRATKANPDTAIALVGCQAQLQAADLATLPNVRWVVGNARKMELPAIVAAGEGRVGEPQVVVEAIPREAFTMPTPGIDPQHHRANLKIQDGCDFHCLFCEIPYARGRARSRVYADLLAEARALMAAGHRELVLTGVNIGTYQDSGRDFLAALDGLLALPGMERLRISSIEPTTIDAEITERFGPESALCRHLHIPLQSGSDPVLARMNRRYTVAEYTAFLEQMVAAVPDICLGTDVIVGYPSETEALFDETADLLLALPLAYFHVFSYSERSQARSRRILRDQVVPPAEIARRSRVLRELSDRRRRAYHERFLGRTETVLFEHRRDGLWLGHTDTFIRVAVASERDLEDVIAPVRLESADARGMAGRLR